MNEVAVIESRLPSLGLDDWDEIRKAEATLDAYLKYAKQDKGLEEQAAQIGEALVLLKWHKGRILSEMEKNRGQLHRGDTMSTRDDKPTYDSLGIHPKQASREQLLCRSFDEGTMHAICEDLISEGEVPTVAYFLRLAKKGGDDNPVDVSFMREDEAARRIAAMSGSTVLANKRTDSLLVAWAKKEGVFQPIDRGSIWGNPFLLGSDGDRDTVVNHYDWYYDNKPSLQKEIEQLRGSVLGCWCYPKRCHGNVIIERLGGGL